MGRESIQRETCSRLTITEAGQRAQTRTASHWRTRMAICFPCNIAGVGRFAGFLKERGNGKNSCLVQLVVSGSRQEPRSLERMVFPTSHSMRRGMEKWAPDRCLKNAWFPPASEAIHLPAHPALRLFGSKAEPHLSHSTASIGAVADTARTNRSILWDSGFDRAGTAQGHPYLVQHELESRARQFRVGQLAHEHCRCVWVDNEHEHMGTGRLWRLLRFTTGTVHAQCLNGGAGRIHGGQDEADFTVVSSRKTFQRILVDRSYANGAVCHWREWKPSRHG